jgi:hypothetical protein
MTGKSCSKLRGQTAGLIAMLVVASFVPAQPVAMGWANGTGGCNSFGTHDWILKKAIGAAEADANWVRTRVALRATDDPDCEDGIDHASGTWWHVYDRWGSYYGGADEAAAVWFRRIKHRLDDFRERVASKALGYLAHIVGDIGQPMHTDQRDREDSIHSPYESDVDERVGFSFPYDGRQPAKPAKTVRRLAHRAHRHYFDLIRAYDRHGFNRKVRKITRRQLRDATNELADLIAALR